MSELGWEIVSLLDEGVYCVECSVFEQEDLDDEGKCRACGCWNSEHVTAHVVQVVET